MKYFQMTYAEDKDYEIYGVAYISSDVDPFLLPISGKRVKSWVPIYFELRDGKFSDYLTNDLGARLCSEKLKTIIENNLTKNDQLQWLEAIVVTKDGHPRKYYILHFPEDHPIINEEKSIMAGGMVVKPVIDQNCAKEHNIFTLPKEAGRTIFLSESLKKIIDKSKLTGMSFLKVSVA